MSDIKRITDFLINFRDDRNWEQFHNTKDLAIAIGIEAGELNELFLWKTPEQTEEVDKEKVADELADIMVYSLMLAHKQGFDVEEIIMRKMRKNGEKYPVEKSKGKATKYTDL
jgi:NTP pyrophosphatase (non-canonical NTP hydrolase)